MTRRPDVPDAPDPQAVQPALPLDIPDTVPVPFRLTPRGRRAVAPDAIPRLEVVAEDASPDAADEPESGPESGPELPRDLADPHDPRRARARAMRRAGVPPVRIARALGVDEVAVRAWADDAPEGGRATPAAPRRHSDPPRAGLRAIGGTAGAPDPEPDQERFAVARAAAMAAAPPLLASPQFVRGLALVAAIAQLDRFSLHLTTADLDIATRACEWLRTHAGVSSRDLRAVLRVPPAGADLLARRWADALGLSGEVVRHVPRHDGRDGVELMLRVADPEAAARVAGWRDVLLAVSDLHDAANEVAF